MTRIARIIALLTWTMSSLGAAVCYAQQERWIQSPVNSHWYTTTGDPLVTWTVAESQAVALGGHLATVRSQAESEWLTNLFPEHVIGLTPSCDWVSGEPLNYQRLCDLGYCTDASLGTCPTSACWRSSYAFPPSDEVRRGCVERTVPLAPGLPGTWSQLSVIQTDPASPPSLRARLCDLNGDSILDLVDTSGLSIVRRLGNGSSSVFDLATAEPIAATATSIHTVDLDANGRDDLILGRVDELQGVLTPASGAPIALPPVFLGAAPVAYAAGDFDADAHMDLAVLTGNQRLRIVKGNGTGALLVTESHELATPCSSLRAGDLDDDGDLDLLATAEAAGEFLIWSNNGNGTFSGPTFLLRGFHPRHAELVDMDQDGRLDIVTVGQWNGWKVQVLRRIGPNQFAPMSAVSVSSNIRGIQAADMDGNGTPDLFLDADSPQLLLTDAAGGITVSTTFNRLLGRGFALEVSPNPGLELVGFTGACSTLIVSTSRNAADCNQNGIQDQAEILVAPEIDLDADNIIDSCEQPGVAFCFGDGSGAACPCDPGQAGTPGGGCRNSFGGTGTLGATGNAGVALDSVTLRATGFLPTGIGLVFQGNSQQASGIGSVLGDGLLCVSQSIVRLAIRNAVAGVISLGREVSGDQSIAVIGQVPAAGGTRHYQIWYRDPALFCTSSTFNFTNGLTIEWQP